MRVRFAWLSKGGPERFAPADDDAPAFETEPHFLKRVSRGWVVAAFLGAGVVGFITSWKRVVSSVAGGDAGSLGAFGALVGFVRLGVMGSPCIMSSSTSVSASSSASSSLSSFLGNRSLGLTPRTAESSLASSSGVSASALAGFEKRWK